MANRLPAKLKKRFGVVQVIEQTPLPVLMLWGSWTGFDDRTNHPPTLVTVLDSAGNESAPIRAIPGPFSKVEEREMAWRIPNFPRRQRNLRIRVYQDPMAERLELVGEFEISNPAPARFPRWEPQPYPQTVTNGDLECTLLRFGPLRLAGTNSEHLQKEMRLKSAGVPSPAVASVRQTPQRKRYAALFNVKAAILPESKWRPQIIELQDATGNVTKPGNASSDWDAGIGRIRFEGPLWSSEWVWKLKVGFVRTEGFQSNEMTKVENIPTHLGQRVVDIATNLPVEGVSITGIVVRPLNLSQLEPGGIRSNAEIVLKGASAESAWFMTLLQLTDQTSQPLAFEAGEDVRGGWAFRFRMRDDTRTLTLNLVAQKVRQVEFVSGFSE
jgi:hypothetical protein